jgi:hypothetical protein
MAGAKFNSSKVMVLRVKRFFLIGLLGALV